MLAPARALARLARAAPRTGRAAASASAGAPSTPPPLATRLAFLAVGDELLSGAVTDANTPWAATRLTARGADVVEASFVRDDEQAIAATAGRLALTADAVVASGGVGPTHDDVTYAALAGRAGLARHAGTVRAMQESYGRRGVPLTEARLTMADLPAAADEVLTTPGTWVPLVRVGKVYILPGVPKLYRMILAAHEGRFGGPLPSVATLLTRLGEGDVAMPLREVAGRHPGVKLGSYILDDGDAARVAGGFNVRLRASSRDPAALAAAVEDALGALACEREEA